MAQPKEIMALRKRMSKRGYYGISIEILGDGKYMVKALEPLAGMGVQRVMDLDDIYQAMR